MVYLMEYPETVIGKAKELSEHGIPLDMTVWFDGSHRLYVGFAPDEHLGAFQKMGKLVDLMADSIIDDWQHNGMECWQCGEIRPLDLEKNVSCPHCGTAEYVPF